MVVVERLSVTELTIFEEVKVSPVYELFIRRAPSNAVVHVFLSELPVTINCRNCAVSPRGNISSPKELTVSGIVTYLRVVHRNNA